MRLLMADLIHLTRAQFNELREKHYELQGRKCAITGLPYDLKDCVFDHRHKLKAEECGGPDGLGLLRGVIGRNVNTFEGKIWKAYKRYGLEPDISLPDLLRRLADYIENPPCPQIYIHPNERPKRQRLLKPDYKRVCKYYFCMYPKRRKLPQYPKDGIRTPKWDDLIDQADAWRKIKLSKDQKKLVEKAKRKWAMM
jgi:hypothetical protein